MMAGADAQINQYKRSLFDAVLETNTSKIHSFLEDRTLHLDLVKNQEKQNLFHFACLEGAEEVLEVMLKFPKVLQKLEDRDGSSRTPLHLAAAMGYDNVVRRLVGVGAEVDARDEKGASPLLLAVRFEWAEVARALLEAGANPMLEDNRGTSAVDVANAKPDGEVAMLMSGFTNQRRHKGPFHSVRQFLFPRAKPHVRLSGEESQNGGSTGAVGTAPELANLFIDDGFEEEVFATMGGQAQPGGSPGPSGLRNVMEEAVGQGDIDLRLDDDGDAGARPAKASSGSKQAEEASAGGWWKRAVAEQGGAAKPRQQASAAAAAYGAPQGGGSNVVRMHMFFDEQVKRLEFEVEWQAAQPAAGLVKPGGEADRRGLLQGDAIVEIAGQPTAGKSREELLPLMKQRPLMLKVYRTAAIVAEPQPHAELSLSLLACDFEDRGLEVTIQKQMPVVTVVRPNSKAWVMGLMEGDAIVCLNGKDTAKSKKALDEQLQSATVWRRPLGSPNATWSNNTE